MFHIIILKIRTFLNVWKVAVHYLHCPYYIQQRYIFDEFNHEHVCLAARLAQVNLSEICPYKPKNDIDMALTDECEFCKYFGMIRYELDPETKEKQIRIIGDDRFITSIDTQNLRKNLTT